MAINYPLALPTITGIKNIDFRAQNAVAYSTSPFTFQGQAHAYAGQRWTADITLPPMKRAQAEVWNAFLMSLRGQYGTFLLNDPDAKTPRDVSNPATSATITGTAGSNTVQATIAIGKKLLAGDYFQVGTGSSSRLHKVLQDFTGTGSAANLEIWPSLREAASGVSANLSSASGVFMLASNESGWTVNEASTYGISFSAVERI